MANHELPRKGSAAADGLIALQGMGGVATLAAWTRAIGWRSSLTQFEISVADRLRRAGLILACKSGLAITDAGYSYLGVKIVDESVPRKPVGPRYVAPDRPLNVKRMPSPFVMRAGAMDFRSIPSRIGDERIPYKGPTGISGAATE